MQDGARLHYAVPRALANLGWLEKVFTDFLIRPGSVDALMAFAARASGSLGAQRMRERRCPEIAKWAETIPLRSLWWRTRRSRFATVEDYFEWVAKKTGQWMADSGFGKANMVHGFIRHLDPEFCAECQKKGLRTVGDQMIAPALIERREMEQQRKNWPGWEMAPASSTNRLEKIEEDTWTSLDHVTCASDYVRNGLIGCGVDAGKISIIPYPALLMKRLDGYSPARRGDKLRVGFLGSVNLRKGAPVFLEMAKRLAGKNVEFSMVGPISIPADAAAQMRGYVQLTGPVPRSEVARHLQSFDIFFFPSVCEGSASVVMEAMAAGLPVVTTPNSGTVIRHGIEGFIHEPTDWDGMADSLQNLLENKSLRVNLGVAAQSGANQFDLLDYQGKLGQLLPTLL